MKRRQTILVVDDEEKIRDVIELYLEKAGYRVYAAHTGADCLRLVSEVQPALVILDLMLPDMSGEEVCQRIRAQFSTPILMLTAKHREQDRLQGLRIGADDYVTKPFSVKEVVLRVGVILRRSEPCAPLAQRIAYHNGQLVLDASQLTAFVGGKDAELTTREFNLLSTLCRSPNRVFTRNELIELAFGMDYAGDTRAIDVHIKNLRSKIESNPKQPKYVQTVYGTGYRFGGGPT